MFLSMSFQNLKKFANMSNLISGFFSKVSLIILIFRPELKSTEI